MHIFGFLARTVTPLHEHSPDGPNLQGLRGGAQRGGHTSWHGGGHGFSHTGLGAHGGGHTGLQGGGHGSAHTGGHAFGAHGGGHTGLQGSAQTGLHCGGHIGLQGSQTGGHGSQQSSP